MKKSNVIFALFIFSIFSIFYGKLYHAPCDDAYIFYVYAKNLLDGNGLTYNGTIVWGFTSVLWVFLLSLVGLIGIPIHIGGEILSLLSGGFALFATYFLGRSVRLNPFYALLPVLLLSMAGDFAFYASVGLEQVLFIALVAISTALIFFSIQDDSISVIGIAAIMALMIMTRPEGMLFFVLLLLMWSIKSKSVKNPLVCGLLVICFLAPFWVILRINFGDWLPNTYYAKSNAGLANLQHGLDYIVRNLARYSLLLFFILASLFYKIFRKENIKLIFLLIISLIWILYIIFQGGDNMVGGRVIIPILPLIYVFIVYFASQKNSKSVILIMLLGVGQIISYSLDKSVHRHINNWRKDYNIRKKAGFYLKNNFESDTIVALNPAGIIPYYSGFQTIDMLGLNDYYIGHNGKRDRSLRFAHQTGDGAYVLSKEPDVILFGGTLEIRPGHNISGREIWRSEEFHNNYNRVYWENIGIAYIRKDSQ